jgi:UDP-glucose 4-epimerase
MVGKKIPFYKVSIINKKDLEEAFKRHKFYAVIHSEGKKAVDESEEKPLFYYENNFVGNVNLINYILNTKSIISFSQVHGQFMETGTINQKKKRKCFSQ